MVTRYLLDTNICIYIRQKRPTAVLKRFEKLSVGDAAISVITYGELFYGAEHSPAEHRQANRRLLAELIELMPVLPMPYTAGEAYGALREALTRDGQMIGNNDLWIAAHAKAEGLILVTNNGREFKRVFGLKVENWVA
ncbi:MAG: type II toxin-antitoxin system VapC family toxin [Alphaproteobacteria bacterium]|nr:type II toxin-antitoxin system VapC family toxin [Alphaproteobacteria bacterium]